MYLGRVLTTPATQLVPHSNNQPTTIMTADSMKKKKVIPSITSRKVITTIKVSRNIRKHYDCKVALKPIEVAKQRLFHAEIISFCFIIYDFCK